MKKFLVLALQNGYEYVVGKDLQIEPKENVEIEEFLFDTKEEAEIACYKFGRINTRNLMKGFYTYNSRNRRELKRFFKRYFRSTMYSVVEVVNENN